VLGPASAQALVHYEGGVGARGNDLGIPHRLAMAKHWLSGVVWHSYC